MANFSFDERQPLLSNSSRPTPPPPEYSIRPASALGPNEILVSETDADELPPPYTPSTQEGVFMINCRVCQTAININGRTNQHVVKCSSCGEATPIKKAPTGKKYIRCKCNCLLICKATSRRVACPRENCKLIMVLESPVERVPDLLPGTSRVICACCHQPFLFNIANKALARCPHCKKVSSVGKKFLQRRRLMFLIPGIVFLAGAILLTIFTHEYARTRGGLYATYVIVFIVSLLLLGRAVYYCTIKISPVDDMVNV